MGQFPILNCMCVNVGPTPSSSPSGFAVDISGTSWFAVGLPRLIVGTNTRIMKMRRATVNNPLGVIVSCCESGGSMGNFECVEFCQFFIVFTVNTYQQTRNPSCFLEVAGYFKQKYFVWTVLVVFFQKKNP